MKFSALAIGFFAALSVAAPAPEDVVPPASEVYIEQAIPLGSGCPAGSTLQFKSDDWKTVTLYFGKYEARIGPKYPPPNPHVNCALNLKIHYPKGYQYTIYKINYTGYAKLDPGVVATQVSTYWFAGFPSAKASLKSTWPGAYDGPYSFTDTLVTEKWVWSPCGETTTMNVNTYLDLNNDQNPGGSGKITADEIDANVHNIILAYGIYWRRC